MNKPKSKYYATVGRVESFENAAPRSKLSPVSCTVFEVADSMDSISDSWKFLAQAVKGGAGVAIDLSNLRAKGIVGSGGLISLGVCNFLPVYSAIVAAVRQGKAGAKKGAGLVYISASSPDLKEYLSVPTSAIPSLKRAVYVTQEDIDNPEICNLLLRAMSKGDIFLSKVVYNREGERLFANLCTEVFIKSRGTCILGQVNLGMIENIEDIPTAFCDGLHELDLVWRSSYYHTLMSGHYLDPCKDKQIGLGVIGLGNLLASQGVTYKDLASALKLVRESFKSEDSNNLSDHPAVQLALRLYKGYILASRIAMDMGYERAFAIAPTASVSYRNVDFRGFTCTPEISPPVCNPTTKIVRRLASEGTTVRQYPHDVEVANIDVPWETYDELVNEWQLMQDVGGLAHAISYNWWSTKPFTQENLQAFMDSPRKTIYYAYPVEVDAADKTNIKMEELSSSEVDEFWQIVEEEEGGYDPFNDPNYCEACAG
jgi:hypothetical protein